VSAVAVALGRFWRALLADLDLYALIIAGVLFSILGVSGIADVKDLSSVTLAGLTLLAFSQARTRRLALRSPQGGQLGSVLLTDFPADLYVRRAGERASYIFVGFSGSRTIGTGRHDFQSMLDRGARLRFLLLDLEDEAVLRAATMSGATDRTPERTRERIRGALNELGELNARNQDALQVRLLPFPPSIGVNGFGLERADGVLFVQQQISSAVGERSPIFRVDASDGYWHRHFTAEVERLWSKGRAWRAASG
jgi:hypothetical protein